MEIVFATANPHKLEEINEISKGSGIKFILPPAGFNPVENGATFEENSLIKAKAANKLSGKMSLADDSGLCVESLNGAPGLYSARYAGTQAEKISKLLEEMKDKTNRKAKFVCTMTLLDESGNILCVKTGECHGEIAHKAAGCGGFGYDPIFLVEGAGGKTMAEMTEHEKNEISHRGRALRMILEFLSKNNAL